MKKLETKRLFIRPFLFDDCDQLATILRDPEVMRYSVKGVMSQAQTSDFIAECIDSYERAGFGPWAVVEKCSNRLIGFTGFNEEALREGHVINLGYRLAKEYWGKGFAYEAVSEALGYGFNSLGMKSVVAIIEPDNLASIRLAEKVGFDEYEVEHYHGRDVHQYSLSWQKWSG